jgi:hypothetical protein
MATSPPQDSELAHSFGPQEIGFDYLPLELTPPDGFDLRTQPPPPVPMIDLASSGPLELPAIEEGAHAATNGNGAAAGDRRDRAVARDGVAAYKGKFWLEGDVLMCACPDCQAPMSIRLWLMVADCWRCGASIELTEEQEREVQRLLEQRRLDVGRDSVARRPAAERRSRTDVAAPRPPAPAERVSSAPPPPIPPSPPPPPPAQARQRPSARRRVNSTSRWLNNLLKDTPAWLISMVVHMIAFTLMALLNVAEERDREPFILLSTMVAREPDPGGDTLDILRTKRRSSICRCRISPTCAIPRSAKCSSPPLRTHLICGSMKCRPICPTSSK